VFSDKQTLGNIIKEGKFKAKNLKEAICSVLEEKFGAQSGDERMMEERRRCRTQVFSPSLSIAI
jgi:hypothetical protein